MGYVVDYKRIDFLYGQAKTANIRWNNDLSILNDAANSLMSSDAYDGVLADSMKAYLKEIHLTSLLMLANIISDYFTKFTLYKDGYTSDVDTALVAYMSEEVLQDAAATLKTALQTVLDLSDDIPVILDSIRDLYNTSAPSTKSLEIAFDAARKVPVNLNTKIQAHETNHSGDFADMDALIAQAKTLIENQMNADKRIAVSAYQPSMITNVINVDTINTAVQNTQAFYKQHEADIKKALENATEREQALQESREWIQWVAVGVAIVGSVALIAVTAGAAGPVVCAAVGGVSGLASAAVGDMAENYIANGYLTEGMDWAEFGKDCTIGAVTGAINGYGGAIAHGTTVVQPLQKATTRVVTGLIKNGSELIISTTFDYGKAVIKDRPKEEVQSVLSEDIESGLRKTATSAASDFATGYISGVHGASSGDKSAKKIIGEKIFESTVETAYKEGLDDVLLVGEGILGVKDWDEVQSGVDQNLKDFVTDLSKSYIGDVIDGGTENVIDDIDNPLAKGMVQGVESAISSGASDLTGGLVRQGIESFESHENKFDIRDIWETDMKGGRNMVESGITDGFKEGINETEMAKDAKLQRQLNYYDKNGDGRIETVNVGPYRVAKEELEAAQKMAGKDGYKDKTAQEILGLDKDADLSRRQYSYNIDDLKKSDVKKNDTKVTKLSSK